MMKVRNKKVIARLSNRSLKAGKLRNLVAILAIALTAILFTALFTIGGSLVATIQNATMRQVGTSAHGGFKCLTQEQYDVVLADSKIKDISYDIIVGFAENPELKKTYTEIRWTEEKAAEWSFCTPTEGRLPREGMELATTTAVLDALGAEHKLGAQVPLTFTANGITYHEIFTLCGFWEMDIALGVNEAFVSREFCDRVAPVWSVPLDENVYCDYSDIAGGINPSIYFFSSWDIEGQMARLMERCGFDANVNSGVNWAYASADVDIFMILLLVCFILLVLVSGYLIIYNIFAISVTQDIRYYGLLKTIGTTGKQLKRLVRRQAFLLCIAGIPLGLLAGWLCGVALLPAVMKSTTMADYYAVSASPLIFIAAALFALLTVWMSCIRPCRIAARVSPIEAVRYTEGKEEEKAGKKHRTRKSRKISPLSMAAANIAREKKKAVLVALSLTLSMVLFAGTYTIVGGFDMDIYLADKLVTDFVVTDATVRKTMGREQTLDGVTDSALEFVRSRQGLEGMGSVYVQLNTHELSDAAYERGLSVIEKNSQELPSPFSDASIQLLKEDHSIYSKIYGVDDFLWNKLEIYNNAKLDKEKFASGDYVIVTSFWDDGSDCYYETGEKITLVFKSGKTKEYTVLAIGAIPYALEVQFYFPLELDFILPAEEYKAQAGDAQPLATGFDIEPKDRGLAEEAMEHYCSKVESDLYYESRDVYVQEFKDTRNMFLVVGGVLSVILGLIGVLNFSNAVVTSILARRREFAMLASVGMTGRQLQKMLISEGCIYVFTTLFLTLSVGNVFIYYGIKALAQDMWFFVYHFTPIPMLVCIPILIIIAVGVPMISYRIMAKQSVVERLRVVE